MLRGLLRHTLPRLQPAQSAARGATPLLSLSDLLRCTSNTSSSSSSNADPAQNVINAYEEACANFTAEGTTTTLFQSSKSTATSPSSSSSAPAVAPLASLFPDSISEQRDAVCLLLRAFCSTGQVARARRLYTQFLAEIPPQSRSTAVFDTWLQLLVQQPAISKQEVNQLLDTMENESGLERTALTYQSLIEAHIRLQLDPSPLYYEMKSRGIECTPNVLSLFVKGVAPFRPREAEESNPRFHVDVLREYLRKAKPSEYDISFLKQRFLMFVSAPGEVAGGGGGANSSNNQNQQRHHHHHAPETALWLLFEIEQRCVVECASLRDVVERTPLVQLLLRCARCGDAATVAGVVGVMERHLIPKSADVLSLTLWAQAVAGRVGEALDTLEDMCRRGLLDHVDHTRRYVIEALGTPIEKHYLTILAEALGANAETVDKALAHLQSRHQRGLTVSVHSLDVIVLACSKLGDEQRAVTTLESYTSLGVQPRTQSYNALLFSCSGKNKARRHRSIFEAMQRRGVAPNYHTLRILIRQAVMCNNTEEALEYLEKAKTTPGVRIDVEMLLAVFERACRVGDLETALIVSRMALDCDIGIDAAIVRMGAERLKDLGVDPAQLLETITVHEKLRGKHGVARR